MRINRRYVRPGDLVFFYSGRTVHHVGVNAGKGCMYARPARGHAGEEAVDLDLESPLRPGALTRAAVQPLDGRRE